MTPPTARAATLESALFPRLRRLPPKLLAPRPTPALLRAALAKPCALLVELLTVLVTDFSAPETMPPAALAMLEKLQKCGWWPSFTSELKVCTAFQIWLDPREAR